MCRYLHRTVSNLKPLAPGPAGEFRGGALIGETVLHGDDHGAAQPPVQSVDWVGTNNVDPVDRCIRKQVPVERVAKGLVNPHAVLIDGETLRRPEVLVRPPRTREIECQAGSGSSRSSLMLTLPELTVQGRGYAGRNSSRVRSVAPMVWILAGSLSMSMPVPGSGVVAMIVICSGGSVSATGAACAATAITRGDQAR